MDYPESAEAVALCLFSLIISMNAPDPGNRPIEAHLLDLFRECLKAARGDGGVTHGLH